MHGLPNVKEMRSSKSNVLPSNFQNAERPANKEFFHVQCVILHAWQPGLVMKEIT